MELLFNDFRHLNSVTSIVTAVIGFVELCFQRSYCCQKQTFKSKRFLYRQTKAFPFSGLLKIYNNKQYKNNKKVISISIILDRLYVFGCVRVCVCVCVCTQYEKEDVNVKYIKRKPFAKALLV